MGVTIVAGAQDAQRNVLSSDQTEGRRPAQDRYPTVVIRADTAPAYLGAIYTCGKSPKEFNQQAYAESGAARVLISTPLLDKRRSGDV